MRLFRRAAKLPEYATPVDGGHVVPPADSAAQAKRRAEDVEAHNAAYFKCCDWFSGKDRQYKIKEENEELQRKIVVGLARTMEGSATPEEIVAKSKEIADMIVPIPDDPETPTGEDFRAYWKGYLIT